MAKVLRGKLQYFERSGGTNIGSAHCIIQVAGDKRRRVQVNNDLLGFLTQARAHHTVELELIGIGLGPLRSGLAKITMAGGQKVVASPVNLATNSLAVLIMGAMAFLMLASGDPVLKTTGTYAAGVALWLAWPLLNYMLLPKSGFSQAAALR